MTSKMILFRSTVILVLLLFLTFVNSRKFRISKRLKNNLKMICSEEFEDSDYKSRGKVEGRPNSRPSNNRPPNNWSSNSQSRPSNSDGQQRPQSGSGSYRKWSI
jgi:FtsZ-interacting cell division protein ZipA